MSTPVITDKWAGTFDCGTCRRKRLMGEEFSKKALERHRRDGGTLKCKKCVAVSEQAERDAAKARQQQQKIKIGNNTDDANPNNNNNNDDDDDETRTCSSCTKDLKKSEYNRNQWSKGEGKSRCRGCVEKSIQEESANQTKSKQEKIEAARKKVQDAHASGNNAAKILAAESELAALEAEQVTGLKPIKLSSSGRGRGRGGGRGRFSGGRGGRGGSKRK